MAFLQDTKTIDMRRSGIPKEEWQELAKTKDFAKYRAQLKFVPKDYKQDPTIRPKYKFWWNRNTPRDIEDWLFAWNSVPVTPEDGYIPTHAILTAENTFTLGDLIFMKISLNDWIDKQRIASEEAKTAAEANMREFDNLAKKHGADLSDNIKEDLGLFE